MEKCKNRFNCVQFMVFDCKGHDCYNDGYTFDHYLNDYDQDDADFIG